MLYYYLIDIITYKLIKRILLICKNIQINLYNLKVMPSNIYITFISGFVCSLLFTMNFLMTCLLRVLYECFITHNCRNKVSLQYAFSHVLF